MYVAPEVFSRRYDAKVNGNDLEHKSVEAILLWEFLLGYVRSYNVPLLVKSNCKVHSLFVLEATHGMAWSFCDTKMMLSTCDIFVIIACDIL